MDLFVALTVEYVRTRREKGGLDCREEVRSQLKIQFVESRRFEFDAEYNLRRKQN